MRRVPVLRRHRRAGARGGERFRATRCICRSAADRHPGVVRRFPLGLSVEGADAESASADRARRSGAKPDSELSVEDIPEPLLDRDGLYPGHHGIVANNIFDPPTGRTFATAKREEVRDPMWWGGTPIWTLVERAAGSRRRCSGRAPRRRTPALCLRTGSRLTETPGNARIDQILSWLDRPAAQRPTFLTLYFEDTDSAGHANGPDSPEVRDAIVRDDAYIGRLVDGLTRRGLIDRVNLVVVSDHGMTAVDDTRVIVADDYVSAERRRHRRHQSDARRISEGWQGRRRLPEARQGASALEDLQARGDAARWHYRDHPRVPPILALPTKAGRCCAEERWTTSERERFAGREARTATTRNSCRCAPSSSLPARRSNAGRTVAPFENVSVYNVLADILHLTPPLNDGDPAVVRALLREDTRVTVRSNRN
jgi:hypothetical protein